ASVGICEARVFHGVISGPIYRYVGQHLIRARRDMTVTRDKGWEIAASALTYRRSTYSRGAILKLHFQSILGYWNFPITSKLLASSVICSALYERAYSRVTG